MNKMFKQLMWQRLIAPFTAYLLLPFIYEDLLSIYEALADIDFEALQN